MTRQDIRDIVNKTTAYSFMRRKVARTRWSNVLCNGPTQTEVCSTENPDGSHVVNTIHKLNTCLTNAQR